MSWARLIERVLDCDVRHCPNCGAGELNKVTTAILKRPVIERILTHLGLDAQPLMG